MLKKLVLAFLLGCMTGAGVVWLTVTERAGLTNAAIVSNGAASTPTSHALASPEPAKLNATGPIAPDRLASSPSMTAVSVGTSTADAPPPATYDFGEITGSERKLEDIFRAERVDRIWASQSVDSLNLLLSTMPERAVIGDYGLSCKESLCKLEIRGDPNLVASRDPKNNIQPALMRMISEPPASEIFDNSMMRVSIDNDGLATLTLFAHRRKPKH